MPTASRFFSWVELKANATNVKAAAPWGKRNCCAARTLFVPAALVPHEESLTTAYRAFYGGGIFLWAEASGSRVEESAPTQDNFGAATQCFYDYPLI